MITYQEAIKIPCREINTYPESQIEEIINVVIDHYYANGFPYYSQTSPKIDKEFQNLVDFDVTRLELENKTLQQFMLGLSSANAFHPEMWDVQCKKSKTSMQIYKDRKLFYAALRKRVRYSDTRLVDFNVRKSLKAFGVQAVSNFRPTISKWVYEKFCPEGGKALDPCAGYGGRLMGAMTSHIDKYVGIDPNRDTQEGNQLFSRKLSSLGSEVNVELYITPFEDFDVFDEYDVAFTSPPYFDIEKYSKDSNQSYIRYPNKDLWIDKFLRVLITKSYNAVKLGGYVVLNVGGEIIKETQEIGTSLMGEPEIYYMRLSKILGQKDKEKTSHKVEPIFVWKK